MRTTIDSVITKIENKVSQKGEPYIWVSFIDDGDTAQGKLDPSIDPNDLPLYQHVILDVNARIGYRKSVNILGVTK